MGFRASSSTCQGIQNGILSKTRPSPQLELVEADKSMFEVKSSARGYCCNERNFDPRGGGVVVCVLSMRWGGCRMNPST